MKAKDNLDSFDILKRIHKLSDEYDRIRDYKYDDYDSGFDAINRKNEIEVIFNELGIKYKRFLR